MSDVQGALGRCIHADLDSESSLRPTEHRKRLPSAAWRQLLSDYGSLLRVFAEPGDSLWTPLPLTPERLPLGSLRALPLLENGDGAPNVEARYRHWLRWAPLELPFEAGRERGAHVLPESGAFSFRSQAWDAPRLPLDVLRTVTHRQFASDVCGPGGCELPGATVFDSIASLETHLSGGAAAVSPNRRWVLKAPYSAAGRERFLGDGEALPLAGRRRIERLLASHGELLFEPWMERVEDFGLCAWVDDSATRVLAIHRLEVDGAGRFRAVSIPPEHERLLSAEEQRQVEENVESLGRALRAAGYVGHFGVDFWRYREADGTQRLHYVGELNPRFTFGYLAHAWREAVAEGMELSPHELACRLVLDAGTNTEATAIDRGTNVFDLLRSTPTQRGRAWLEVCRKL